MGMGKLNKVGYELCDINIIQSEISHIEHRGECDTMIEMCGRKVHPVIVAPMAAVTNADNYKVWLDNNFICVVPRTVPFEKRLEICTETFSSFSLDEAEELLKNKYLEMFEGKTFYVCVDPQGNALSGSFSYKEDVPAFLDFLDGACI